MSLRKDSLVQRAIRFALAVVLALLWACGPLGPEARQEMAEPVVTRVAFCSCAPSDEVFLHDIESGAKPWKHEAFDAAQDKFTFGIFADLTGGERERIFEVAVAQLNLLCPELILNVGDLIDGGSDDPKELHRQWDWFDERADKARAPVFYMGGNHDLTGEVLRDAWKERLGPRYYHFVYKNVLFLVLDTEDNPPDRMRQIKEARLEAIEIYKAEGEVAFAETDYYKMPERSSGNVGPEQSAYFTEVIAAHPDVRWTFIFIHKPAWENSDERDFAAIEHALADHSYTVFYGHTHVYNHTERKGRDYINLATTGGEQHPDKGRSMDHLTLVTVDGSEVSIANILMEGILDKTGRIPLNGDELEFERQAAVSGS